MSQRERARVGEILELTDWSIDAGRGRGQGTANVISRQRLHISTTWCLL